MNAFPLVTAGDLDDIIARLPDNPRRVRDLLAEAAALARQISSGGYLLNVCEDRWHFAVGFAAGLLAGKISLQPSSQSAETLHQLARAYPDIVCLADARFDSHGLPVIEFPKALAAAPEAVREIPLIAGDRVAAILFTSGSTGVPQAYAKTWEKLVADGRAGAGRLNQKDNPHTLVGTVPVQHCFGFETTFIMALHGGGHFWSGKPFYPQDIAAALAAVPRPRLLITTPFHLSTLLAADVALPEIDLVLSATAPLSLDLAQRAEARLGAPVMEIYGSTETGMVASRRTTEGGRWTLFDGIELDQSGEDTFAQGGHIEQRVRLSDFIELQDNGHFLLHGRHSDLINIAGKRTSLAYLNHQICTVPGVADAAFFLPEEKADGVTRLCAFVVAPELDRNRLMAELRQRLDAVFLPRPIVFLDALPRNATGKLPQAELAALHAERTKRGS